ncbi:MAG: lactate racemase domain-containing protein [Desulfobacterales bacterium]|nr:lactate racemase domain-containing protein [Desulfobacterales bacterium]
MHPDLRHHPARSPRPSCCRRSIDELAAAGMSNEDILILVATGLHRPNEGAELREVIGSDAVFEQVRDRQPLRPGPRSPRRPRPDAVRDPDPDGPALRGSRSAHRGRPGGAALHGRLLRRPQARHPRGRPQRHHPQAARRRHPGPRRGRQRRHRGQPLHQEQLHVVRAVGEIFALNVVIDEERRIGFVNFGPIEASHLEAVAFMRPYAEVPVPAPIQDRGHHQRRLPPGQDLLPDDQGHGRRPRHPGARGHHHHRQRMLGGHGQPGVRGGPARALPRWGPSASWPMSSPATMRASTSGRPRCW